MSFQQNVQNLKSLQDFVATRLSDIEMNSRGLIFESVERTVRLYFPALLISSAKNMCSIEKINLILK